MTENDCPLVRLQGRDAAAKESVMQHVEHAAVTGKTAASCSQKLTALIIPNPCFNIQVLQPVLGFVEKYVFWQFSFHPTNVTPREQNVSTLSQLQSFSLVSVGLV